MVTTATAETVMTTNFIVDAPSRELAEVVAQRAERQRAQMSLELFQRPLADAQRRTIIRVSTAATGCSARMLPASTGQGHMIVLAGQLSEVAGPSLDHELVHATLADELGSDFPRWLNEGLASRLDNAELRAIRARELRDMLLEGTWPDFAALMQQPIRTPKQYAVVESVVDYLLSRYSPPQLVAMGADASRLGLDASLQSHLQIDGVADLERRWRQNLYRVAQAPSQRF
jgi:hypothetical protein